MIDPKSFIFKYGNSAKRKDNQRDSFLDHFQLPEIKRTAVAVETYSVSRNLEKVFKQSNAPTKKNDKD